MRDRATIEVDCDGGVVSVNCDIPQYFSFDKLEQREICRSQLIVEILAPQIRELIWLSNEDLMKKRLEMCQPKTGGA